MSNHINKKFIEIGLKIADSMVYQEDRIWSCYSKDKVDIGEQLTKVIRTLSKSLPLGKKMRALSIGSSAEPQFRILETAFRGGLYLLDIEKEALDVVKERIHRQRTDHVVTVLGDYNKIFLNSDKTELFLKNRLDGQKMEIITLHHSLYYTEENMWHVIFSNLYRKILAPQGAIHAVLMAAESKNPHTTTWIYNHFVGKYFGYRNKQNLLKLKDMLKETPLFKKSQVLSRTNKIHFFVDDFGKFMAVIWMILLYPYVHHYTLKQREEITEYFYKHFWIKKRPLIQEQDHLVIYKGIGFKGLI